MRILVVEDDEKIASFLQQGLQEVGYSVDTVQTAEEALRLFETKPYDAAVVDLMLPSMDGLQMVETLRNRGNRTPI